MNEFEIIRKYFKTRPGKNTLIGAGDDGSAIRIKSSQCLVQSTDLLIESVHFRSEWISQGELGRKALAVNISDILAMGATPHWAHLTLALPKTFPESDLKTFAESFLKSCKEYNIDLIGGDVSSTPGPLTLGVHLTGTARKKDLQTRAAFAKADYLCVTGPLGDASLGLWCWEKGLTTEVAEILKKRHHNPPILIAQSQFLTRHKAVRGMIDLSDGLQSDLQHLPGSWQIDCDAIPLSDELRELCQRQVLNPMKFALAGGEDYQLLFGVKKKHLNSFRKDYLEKFGGGLRVIGQRQSDSYGICYLKDGKELAPPKALFQHFS